MTNVIKFPERKDNDNDKFEYFETNNGGLGIQFIEGSLPMGPSFKGDGYIFDGGLYGREELAQFLWAAAYYLDSEQRYMPEGELVGINYEGEDND